MLQEEWEQLITTAPPCCTETTGHAGSVKLKTVTAAQSRIQRATARDTALLRVRSASPAYIMQYSTAQQSSPSSINDDCFTSQCGQCVQPVTTDITSSISISCSADDHCSTCQGCLCAQGLLQATDKWDSPADHLPGTYDKGPKASGPQLCLPTMLPDPWPPSDLLVAAMPSLLAQLRALAQGSSSWSSPCLMACQLRACRMPA